MSTAAQFIEPTSSSDISNFLATFNEGSARPNQYEVEIFPPFHHGDNRDIQLRCESVTLPGRNLSTTDDTNIHGPLRTVVNNVNYADSVAMVFQASADLRERVFFEIWQEIAFNPTTWNVGYYDEYASGSVDIYLLDRQNQRKYGLKLYECFPKSIGPTELSYATNNEIIKLPIEMNFRYWKTLDILQPSSSDQAPSSSSLTYNVHPEAWHSRPLAKLENAAGGAGVPQDMGYMTPVAPAGPTADVAAPSWLPAMGVMSDSIRMPSRRRGTAMTGQGEGGWYG